VTHINYDTPLLLLFDNLISVLKSKKNIKNTEIPNSILFELLNMTKNNLASLLIESADYIESEYRDILKKEKLIQAINKDDIEKQVLTLKGIAYCIKIKFEKSYEEQFISYLKLADDKYSIETEKTSLDWKEKLATLTLLLLASTSESSAIVLDEEINQKTFEAALNETLVTLKQYGIFDSILEIPKTRGEPPAALFMRSRVTDLPRKTNQRYTNIGCGKVYYLDIEIKEGINEEKIIYLLSRIFEYNDPNVKYYDLKNSIMKISEKYHPQFLTRRVNSRAIFGITNIIDTFFDSKLWELPVKNSN